jgi:hypothetical protein
VDTTLTLLSPASLPLQLSDNQQSYLSMYSAGLQQYSPEPEFLNIQSQLFKESCLFKGQSVQQGLQWLQLFCVASKDYFVKTVKKNITIS